MKTVIVLGSGNSGAGAIHDYLLSRDDFQSPSSGKELRVVNDPDGIDVVLNLKDEDLNISSEVKVDTFKISLEDSTFEKINELFGEENYKLF